MLEVHGGLLVWTWITFLLVLFVLAKVVWKPLLSMLDEREEKISQALVDAERAAENARLAGEKYEEVLEQARREAQSIISASKEKAEKVSSDILSEARVKAQGLVSDAEKKIETEKDKAIMEIRSQVADLSLDIAQKLIQRNLDDDSNRSLIEESLKAIGSRHEA